MKVEIGRTKEIKIEKLPDMMVWQRCPYAVANVNNMIDYDCEHPVVKEQVYYYDGCRLSCPKAKYDSENETLTLCGTVYKVTKDELTVIK